MKEILYLGLLALPGHCALTRRPDEEQETIHHWSTKIREVESKMKACIGACVAAFPEQACLDAQHILQEKEERNLQDTAQEVQEFLTRKYNWVSWSVRLVNHSSSNYWNWRARDHFQQMAGQNLFEGLQVNDTLPGGFLQHRSPTGATRLHPTTDGGAREEGRCPGHDGGPGEADGEVRGAYCQ